MKIITKSYAIRANRESQTTFSFLLNKDIRSPYDVRKQYFVLRRNSQYNITIRARLRYKLQKEINRHNLKNSFKLNHINIGNYIVWREYSDERKKYVRQLVTYKFY